MVAERIEMTVALEAARQAPERAPALDHGDVAPARTRERKRRPDAREAAPQDDC